MTKTLAGIKPWKPAPIYLVCGSRMLLRVKGILCWSQGCNINHLSASKKEPGPEKDCKICTHCCYLHWELLWKIRKRYAVDRRHRKDRFKSTLKILYPNVTGSGLRFWLGVESSSKILRSSFVSRFAQNSSTSFVGSVTSYALVGSSLQQGQGQWQPRWNKADECRAPFMTVWHIWLNFLGFTFRGAVSLLS